jgi:uncharacterized phage protein (TIGR01671 family)
MRDILFRGKRIDNGEWVEGSYVYAEYVRDKQGVESRNIHTIIPRLFDENTPNADVIVIPETVGQWTGLYDKNGMRIIEGDILRITYKDYVLKYDCWQNVIINEIDHVEYTETACYGCGNYGFNCYMGHRTVQEIERNDPNWSVFEIIGNIHDNPELLEEKA